MRYVTEVPQDAKRTICTILRELNEFVNDRGCMTYDMAIKWVVCMMYAILFHKRNNISTYELFIPATNLSLYIEDDYSNSGSKYLEINCEFLDRLDGLFSALPESMEGWQRGGHCYVEKLGPYNEDITIHYMDCTKQDMSAFFYRVEDTIRSAKKDDFAFELYLVRVINKKLGILFSMPEIKQTTLYKEIEYTLGKIINYRGIHACEMQITEHGCELCFFASKSPDPNRDELDIHENYFGLSYYNTPLCGDPFLLLYAKELDCLLNEAYELYQIKE